MSYLIVKTDPKTNPKGHKWLLSIYGTGVSTIVSYKTCKRYIDALKMVQALQIHLTTNDKKVA